jgi:hypothetical protein
MKTSVDQTRSRIVWGAMLCVLVVVVLIPCCPWYGGQTVSRDAGAYLYMGQQILRGQVPYRDLWDHKPPGIHLVNAAGLLIAHGSPWGVWFLEVLSIGAAAGICYRVLDRAFEPTTAAIATSLWVVSYSVILNKFGNLTEEFVLPLQFAALSLFQTADDTKHPRLSMIGFGLTSAAAFLLKPTLIGVWAAIAMVWLFRSPRRFPGRIGWAALGAAALFGATLFWLGLNGAVRDFVDQLFTYNAAYSADATVSGRWQTIVDLCSSLGRSGILLPAVIGLLCAAVLAVRRARWGMGPILLVVMVDIPLEVVLIALPGRAYPHYYLSALPVLAVAAAMMIAVLVAVTPRPLETVVAGLVVLVMSFPALRSLRSSLRATNSPSTASDLGRQLAATTEETDTVLVWGAEPEINFFANRPSPTRYFYQYAFYTPGYAAKPRIEEFERAIGQHPPAVIVDTSPANPYIPPLDASDRIHWHATFPYVMAPAIHPIADRLQERYTMVRTVGWEKWRVYVRKPGRGDR